MLTGHGGPYREQTHVPPDRPRLAIEERLARSRAERHTDAIFMLLALLLLLWELLAPGMVHFALAVPMRHMFHATLAIELLPLVAFVVAVAARPSLRASWGIYGPSVLLAVAVGLFELFVAWALSALSQGC